MKRKILFIGAGRLGTSLAFVLQKHNYIIPAFISKDFPAESNTYLPDTYFVSDFKCDIIQDADVICITVPDDQISHVVERLDALNIDWRQKLFLHTSGCLSSEELLKIKRKGAITGSLHPMQTFHKFFLPESVFRNIIFAAEGDKSIISFATEVTKVLKARIVQLKPSDKVIYHIAAVSSSNFFLALLDYVNQLYKKIGFDEEKRRELILPIVNRSLENFDTGDKNSILTGPLDRGDLETIKSHINYLSKNSKDLLPLYSEISKYILKFLTKDNKKQNRNIEQILKYD